jgi:hypothetical protein
MKLRTFEGIEARFFHNVCFLSPLQIQQDCDSNKSTNKRDMMKKIKSEVN